MKVLRSLCTFALLAILHSTGCSRTETQSPPVERTWPAMGSFASVAVPAAAGQSLDTATDVTREAISEVEAELSNFNPTSLVAALNAAAGTATTVVVTPHAQAVFRLSQEAHQHSGGAFDPTVGPYMYLWGFRSTNAPAAVPTATALSATAEYVGWQRLEWHAERARLSVAGMRLDFGAVAKGYGVDVAFERLQSAGHRDIMVNLGGNLRCAGVSRPRRAGWTVAVRDPYLPYAEGSVGTMTLTAGRATATSGRYERFVEIGGRRYAHVIDPRTGQPVGGMAQVTVVASTAGEADALSTSLFVLGLEAGTAMLRNYPNACALFIPDPPEGQAARAYASTGFLEGFTVASEWEGRVGPIPP